MLFTVLTANCQNGQTKTDNLKISDFIFKSIFGTNTKDLNSIYCLLGRGFFTTPSAENSDSLINNWIKSHPNAVVIPVSSIEPIESTKPKSKLIYCWVIEKNDTLNNFLVKHGCFPGGTMIRPKTWKEMEKWEKELYKEDSEKPDVKVYIPDKAYKTFLDQIKSAEIYAVKNKFGIWNQQKNEE